MKNAFSKSSSIILLYICAWASACGGSVIYPEVSNLSEPDSGVVDSLKLDDAATVEVKDAVAETEQPEVSTTLECSSIDGSYQYSIKYLFNDCVVDGGSEFKTNVSFNQGYSSLFEECSVTEIMSKTKCSSDITITCNKNSNYTSVSKIYVDDVSAKHFTVISDIEYKDGSQAVMCRQTKITSYSKI